MSNDEHGTNQDPQIQEVPSTTPDLQTDLARQLQELVPDAISDGKVDVAKLTELLAADVADSSERFGLFWPGKKRALRAAQEPTTATLRPVKDQSKDWDTTKNVFIEGDNLEVLKILQKHYHGKIKMIYVDPPYNTGKDFVYPDNYKEGLETYLEWTKQVNEDGKKVSTNSESEGRYHSNWLNMMYPRLKLARNLLTQDGVIFISIDDNEIDNLVKICNEVFGEGNHVASFIWKSKSGGANDSGEVAVDHEYIVCFSRSKTDNALGLDPDAVATTSYNNEDERGKYALERLDKQNLQYSSSMDYDLVGPDGQVYKLSHRDPARPNAIWRWSKDKVQNNMDQLVFKDGNVYTKNYQKPGGKPRSLFVDDRFGRTRTGSTEVRELLGGSYFDNPKPTKLLKTLVAVGSTPDSIVLDFFAGSGSTAHSVMAVNAKDGGTRRFIAVQLPEPTDDDDAKRAGFNTIADISRKRIDAAGEQVKAELAAQTVDVGFRAFTLVDTNFSKWRVSSDVDADKLQQHLLELRDSAEDYATADSLLTELLLKQGYSLTEESVEQDIAGLTVHAVGGGLLLAYLDEHTKPILDQLRAVVDKEPARLVILEDAFHGDDELKTNLAQLCKSKGVELWTA
ncbi:site-specific DNA-methyltransferase [Aeromicrobium sp. 50.2.37]|uniref:site-specific DNA-methyltransferase n=1 Tax=Aeromicrobium sp. 50.2.37 TaxID=2969305 RepID=UPI0021502F3A|nr:site-specific DNA-methyltransferase [Aeromicrobium sp. 50.2.37]MCR4511751.1 site-specific DNA-methyltransferase [Aeromicrobium sp. 50.2.37]